MRPNLYAPSAVKHHLSFQANCFRFLAPRVIAFSLSVGLGSALAIAAPAENLLTLQLADVAAAPQTGTALVGNEGNNSHVARIDSIREEPGRRNGYWVNDLNGPLYFYNKSTQGFKVYLDFNGTEGHTGLFKKLAYSTGYGGGLVAFQFHPEYATPGSAHYGVFYTLHLEDPAKAGSALPDNTHVPGLDVSNYQITPAVPSPGSDHALRQSVLIEWRDTDPKDEVFTGTARELLRVEVNSDLNPMGDLLFNPLATASSHPDYGNLYISVGDGGDGETDQPTRHHNPQSLATLLGKILRINPDDPDGAGPLTYSIPVDNPFVSISGARGEIWAYGFRNPHGFSWDTYSNRLIVNDIGYHSWEEVNFVKKGQNYGWASREGSHIFDPATGTTRTLSPNDSILGYQYPVIEYPHIPTPGYPTFGNAISNGFVYRGLKYPALFGKYIFADIATGEIYYAELGLMLAAGESSPTTRCPYSKFMIDWENPLNAAFGHQAYQRLYEVVEAGYELRGGPHKNLPGSGAYGEDGRADVRLIQTSDGEIYITSKSDGMLRRVTGVTISAPVSPETPPRSSSIQTALTVPLASDGRPFWPIFSSDWQSSAAAEFECFAGCRDFRSGVSLGVPTWREPAGENDLSPLAPRKSKPVASTPVFFSPRI